jgi:hypothetical protein
VIWVAFRQVRTQLAVVFGVLVAVAIVLAVTGPHLVHLYDTVVANCAAHGDCAAVDSQFSSRDRLLRDLSQVILLAPALVGMFWGAPLVARELETSTLRLSWTQSVSRTRWFATKLGVVGLASVTAIGLLTLMVTWWSSPFDRLADQPFSTTFYDKRDLVPLAFAVFAFVLGVTAGMLIRRTLPAMAVTLVGFIAVRELIFWKVRPYFMTPLKSITAFVVPAFSGPVGVATTLNPADWVVSDQTINGSGRVIGSNGGFGSNGSFSANVSPHGTITLDGQVCANKVTAHVAGALNRRSAAPPAAITRAMQECVDKLHIRQVIAYQPANRFWPFQIYETALFVALALVLAGFCLWWIRHRLS